VNWHPALRFAPQALGIAAAALLVGALLSQPALVRKASGWLHDAPIALFTPRADFSGVLTVDLAAPAAATEAGHVGIVPYRRETLGRIARYLDEHGARAVVFNLLFAEAQADDAELAARIGPNTVLAAAALSFYPRAQEVQRRDIAAYSLVIAGAEGRSGGRIEWAHVDLPAPGLLAADRGTVGVLNFTADDDGIVRRQPLLHAIGAAVLPSLPLATYLAAERSREPLEQRPGRVPARSWPVTDAGEVLVRFPGNAADVPTLSAHRVALAALGLKNDPEVAALVRDRVVFIGNSSVAAGGAVETPAGRLSPLQYQALAYAQLARGAVATPGSRWWNWPLALVALVPGLWLLLRPGAAAARPIGAAAGVVVAIALAGALLSGVAGAAVEWPFALIAGLGAIALALAYNTALGAATRRQRRYERLAEREATRLKTEFLNHLTHELRTPLTAIMGFNKINQFTDELGKESRIANSAIIARNCEHLLALINNNLDLAKIEAGQLAIQRAPEDPEQIMRDVVATMRALAADKRLELKYAKRTPLPEALMLDAFRLRQVLINLMGNAVKFTSRGQVELAVGWHVAALEIEIRDTGPGIAPESLERIWQPFKQADLTVGRRFGGTGLGLAISRKLVEMMGGEIAVESKLGIGSTFRVRLPAEAAPRRASQETPAAPAAIISRDRLAGRILLADDNEDLRNLVGLLLRNLGLQVKSVENGLVAVETALGDQFDVILMDMEMPVMNGYEAVHVLRTRGYSGSIFGLTAHQEGPEVARAILAGCDAVLSKPVSLDGLKGALAPVLERRRAAEPPRTPRRVMTNG
jgi:signal transduction histidine kinase/CheY-like chemotaxis protein